MMMTTEQFKTHVEDITGNNTCHRPDISCYQDCDPCPYVEYCLCKLNTKKYGKRKKRR